MEHHVSALADRFGLSETQAGALEATGNFALTAGAGSGKTHTLTALVARDLIDHDIAPEDILVCTFTRAAAANVTARIEARLRDLAPDRAGEATLRLMCGTIDAVCQRLVLERALDLHVPVSLSPGDERLLVGLRQDAAALVLAGMEPDKRTVLEQAFSPMPERLAGEIQEFHDRAVRMRLDMADLHVPEAHPPTQTEIDEVMALLRQLIRSPDINERAAGKLASDLALLEDGQVMRTHGRPGGVKAHLKPLLEDAKAGMLRLKQMEIDAHLRPAALAIAEALTLYDGHYRALKSEDGIADYTDIAELALKLGGLPAPRKFRRVYVDEAQDTSPLQMAVLESLVAPGGALIPVGDANQSIYGFRDADVTVFLGLVESPDMGNVTLDENYRSQGPVLDGINALARRILVPDDLDPDSTLARGAKALITMKAKATPKAPPLEPPSVDVLYALGDGRNLSAEDEARLAVPMILKQAQDLNLKLSDIAVLCPTNLYLGIYAAQFRRLGIPNLSLMSGGLLDRPECQDLIAYLELLADPPSQTWFMRVATSPIAGLSTSEINPILKKHSLTWDENKALMVPTPAIDDLALINPDVFNAHQRVTALVGRVSVSGLAQAIVTEHGYDLALEANDPTGAQLRNIERLIGAIARVERDFTGPSIRDVLDRLPEDKESVDLRVPAGVDAVRLMTMFGAKGLEFPLVAMTRMSWAPPTEKSRTLAGRDGSVGIARQGAATTPLINAREAINLAQGEERRRVGYVGITRAKDHLMLIGTGYITNKDELSWRGMATTVFKDALDLTEYIPAGATEIITVPGTTVPVRVRRLDPAHPPTPPAITVAATTALEPNPQAAEDDATIPQPMASGAISYSNLEKWRKCGLRRYLERDLGLQGEGQRTSADTTGEDTLTAGDPDRDGREFGALVHETLEHVDWATGLNIDEAIARAKDREAARSHPRPVTTEDERRLRACLERAKAHPVAGTLKTADVQTEVPFATLIGGQLITGVIDVLATLPDGTALIVDWKTGAHFDDHEDDYDLQRRIYSLAMLELEGGPESVEALWVHLEGEGHEQRRVANRQGMHDLKQGLGDDVEMALAGAVTNTTDSPDARCLGCAGLTRICPAAANGILAT
jgi:ATP-dependent exoDNAse (exonuclease V) beta subunit